MERRGTCHEDGESLVLKDSLGHFYLVPRAVLDRYQVPAEASGALERQLAEGETQGYLFPGFLVVGTMPPVDAGAGVVTGRRTHSTAVAH
jgi:hypothetical protein